MSSCISNSFLSSKSKSFLFLLTFLRGINAVRSSLDRSAQLPSPTMKLVDRIYYSDSEYDKPNYDSDMLINISGIELNGLNASIESMVFFILFTLFNSLFLSMILFLSNSILFSY